MLKMFYLGKTIKPPYVSSVNNILHGSLPSLLKKHLSLPTRAETRGNCKMLIRSWTVLFPLMVLSRTGTLNKPREQERLIQLFCRIYTLWLLIDQISSLFKTVIFLFMCLFVGHLAMFLSLFCPANNKKNCLWD